MKDEYITRSEFIHNLYTAKYGEDRTNLIRYGRERGWLESEDELLSDGLLERRNAARIVHEFLLIECGEKDEPDISAASVLKDLYDCHVCTNHIAQVYIKQIMDRKNGCLFSLREMVGVRESQGIIERTLSVGNRKGQ